MEYEFKDWVKKFGQRETWLYLTGIGIAVAQAVGGIDLDWEQLIAVVGPALGVGGMAHVQRGKQRGDELARHAKPAYTEAREVVDEIRGGGPIE